MSLPNVLLCVVCALLCVWRSWCTRARRWWTCWSIAAATTTWSSRRWTDGAWPCMLCVVDWGRLVGILLPAIPVARCPIAPSGCRTHHADLRHVPAAGVPAPDCSLLPSRYKRNADRLTN